MPIQLIPGKICSKCKSEEWKILVRNNRPRYDCADCYRKYKKKWEDSHKEVVCAMDKRYRDSHKIEGLIRSNNWRKANPDKRKVICKRYYHNEKHSLSDHYIRLFIQPKQCYIPSEAISQQTIENFRSYLKIKQLVTLKTQQNELSRINRQIN